MIVSSFNRRLKAEFLELDAGGKGSINYLSFVELMQNIGCVREFNSVKNPNKVKDLWDILGGMVLDSLDYDCIVKALTEIVLIPTPKMKPGNELHKKIYEFFTTYSVTGKGKYLSHRSKPSLNKDCTFHPQLCLKSQAIVKSTKCIENSRVFFL